MSNTSTLHRARLILTSWVSTRRLLWIGGSILFLVLAVVLARKPAPATCHERAVIEGAGPIAFSPDGRTLATAHADKSIRLWAAKTGALQRTLEPRCGDVSAIEFSPDGSTLAVVGVGKGVILWDVRSPAERPRTIGDISVLAIAFSPDGKTLADGGSDISDENTIRLWNVTTEGLRKTLKEQEDQPAAILDRKSKRDKPNASELLPNFEWGFWVSAVVFSPDGSMLASAHGGHRYVCIKLWNARTGRFLRHLQGMGAGVQCLAFLSGGKILAAGCDSGKVMFWDVQTSELLGELQVHRNSVTSLASSPDGRTMATATWDEPGALWDLKTTKQIQSLAGRSGGKAAIAFSPDGKTFAAVSGGNMVRIYDVRR
jgi:WD40 repeat protein